MLIPKHQAERTLTLWVDGDATVGIVHKAQEKGSLKLDYKPRISPRGFETTGHTAFSTQMWGDETAQYMASVDAIPGAEMERIIEAARKLVKQGRNNVEYTANRNNPRSQIIEGVPLDNEPQDDVVEGWGKLGDLRSSSPPPAELEAPKARLQNVSRKPTRDIPGSSCSVSNSSGQGSSKQGSSKQGSSRQASLGQGLKQKAPTSLKVPRYILELY